MLSGLVSLNVHEPLTFEGAEICLHPDLFAHYTTTNSCNNNISNAHHTASNNAAVSDTASYISSNPQPASSKKGIPTLAHHTASSFDYAEIHRTSSSIGGATTVVSAAASAASGAQQPQAQTGQLQVGDMIEIRVWDPLIPRSGGIHQHPLGGGGGGGSGSSPPTAAVTSLSAPNTLRKRPPPPPPPPSTPPPPTAASVAAAMAVQSISSEEQQPSEKSDAQPARQLLKQQQDPQQQQQGASVGELSDDGSNSTIPPPPTPPPAPGHPTSSTSSLDGGAVLSSASTSLATTSVDHGDATNTRIVAAAVAAAAAATSVLQTADDGGGGASSSNSVVLKSAEPQQLQQQQQPPPPPPPPPPPQHKRSPPPSKTPPRIASPRQSPVTGDTLPKVITSSSGLLPPVFPRGRANTTDALSLSVAPLVTSTAATGSAAAANMPARKSALSFRRTPPPPGVPEESASPTSSNPSSKNNNNARGGGGPPVPTTATVSGGGGGAGRRGATALPNKSRGHFRELSDMTVDTIANAVSGGGGGDAAIICSRTTALDVSHQLVDLQLPLAASEEEDDEDDDLWTQLLLSHHLRLSFVMLVTEKSLTSLKSSARTQVSLLRQVADLYQLSSYDMVTVHRIDKEEHAKALQEVSADFVLVTIKDQFLSRGDLHFFQKDLIGTWIYEGQRLHEPTRNIMANAREIRHGGSLARSGIITDNTVITYRSRSARIFWLVQISSEMWDYASPFGKIMDECLCEIYFDKFISFVYELFKKWKEVEATHSLTVVFFSRTFLGACMPGAASAVDQRDVYGRRYEDHCRVVIENETKTDWNSMVVRIREAFSKYPAEVGWNLSTGENTRRPSMASQGNVLEAINVTLNLLQNHYLDRDLHRTGNSIVVVSAGNGVFEVDKGLANITYQRMMDNGIGSDILSLGLPPLHIAPFFLYINEYQGVESEGVDSSETYFEVPHWMHLSFVDYKSDTNVPTETRVNEIDDIDDETNQSPLDIGPNGFLRHRFPDKLNTRTRPKIANPLDHHPTAFSLAGNLAASPAHNKRARGDQERQLISGRDFGDILEACRPRHAGTLPSPLTALIEMYSAGGFKRILQVSISENDESLKEWGALDISDDPQDNSRLIRQRLTLAQDRPSPLFMARSPPRVDELDRLDSLDKASQCSSYTSQISSGRLGVSYDRPFLAHQTSPTLTGIQMQRAPSLEWETDEDSETGFESASTVDLDQTGSDDGDSVATSRFASRLLKSMKAHDSSVLGPRSPKANPMQDVDRSRPVGERSLSTRTGPAPSFMQSPRFGPQPSTTLGALSVPLQTPGSQTVSSGGIGAALMQYGSSTGPSPGATNSSDAETSSNTTNNTMMKSISTGRLLGTSIPALGRIPELPHGFSPLLLPPGALPTYNSSRRDIPNIAGRALELRFIPPQRIADGAESASGVPRNEVMTRHDSFFLNKSHHVTSQSSLTTLSLLKTETSPEKNTRSLSVSPPRFLADSTRKVDRFATQNRMANRDHPSSRRRKKVFNPFRQRDEDEVLAQKSHNRRRWSHVFPLGEVEFKRHAGPSWRSLSAPAILPLSIDYFPPKRDIEHNFTFSIYNVTLSEFEKKHYTSNKYLLMEMVRQRITQDYQLVPDALVKEHTKNERLGDASARHQDSIRFFLSMGHRLQILSYDPSNDTVEVTRYTAKNAQRNTINTCFKYFFLSYCDKTNGFVRTVQTFEKFSDQYNWNKVDRIICGDEDREMREGMRFKRIMFAVIPPRFESDDAEKAYIGKFKRLLEYLEKLREKDESDRPLNIKIVSSADKKKAQHTVAGQQQGQQVFSTPGIAGSSMVRFYVQLRKGKSSNFEWFEVAVDSTFETTWTFRIMFHWLVASSGKIDTQVQLLQRRCTQYGLNLVPFPQQSVSRNVFWNPFRAPAIFTVRDTSKALLVDTTLLGIDFIHDGVFYTDARSIAECIQEDGKIEFDFGQRWSKQPAARQFVHRSGTLFVRIITDKKGWALVVAFSNYRCCTRDDSMKKQNHEAFQTLHHSLELLLDRPALPSPSSGTATASPETRSPRYNGD